LLREDFALELCESGELLDWLKKVGSFDEECSRFYGAEILVALDHMHTKYVSLSGPCVW